MQTASAQPSVLSTPKGRLVLVVLCLAGFLDFVDTTIVNVALPSIRHHVDFSAQNLQWIISGYLLTYGGFLLLGGRAADLIGRRRLLITGTTVFGLSSLAGGLAANAGMLVGARFAQGVGAAMMTPAALSILTTTFSGETDRVKAIGAWSATIPLASAIGVLLGGLLSEGPGWRWVFFVNVPVTVAVVAGALRILPNDRPSAAVKKFDAVGAVLSTGGMLLLVYALVNAPADGWGSARIVGELVGAAFLLGSFVLNEQKRSNPLVPFSILRVPGLAAADGTQVIAQAGFLSMFFFVTLYMQNVLHMGPIAAGAAYIPVTMGVGMSSGIATKLFPKIGTRPLVVAGTLIGAGGVALLSRIPVHGSYVSNVLPGLVVMALGLGCVFVGIQNAANANVPQDKAGLAAALAAQATTLGGALGIAIFSAVANSHTSDLIRHHASQVAALTGGFQNALVVCATFLVAAAVIATRTANSRSTQTDAAEVPSELMADAA